MYLAAGGNAVARTECQQLSMLHWSHTEALVDPAAINMTLTRQDHHSPSETYVKDGYSRITNLS